MAPSDREPVLHIEFGGHRVPPPERSPDDSVGALQLWHDDAALSLAYGASVGARVEGERGTLGGYAANLGMVFGYLAPFMLASLLGPHGRFVLHGGAFQREGRAVIVLGGSGMGKSTLILGALQNGFNVLADDLVVVRRGPSGPLVSGIPKPLTVPGEVVGQELTSWSSPLDSRSRVQVPFEAWDRAWHPVALVVIVAHGDRPATVIEPIERPQLLGMLIGSMLSRQPANIRSYFRLAVALGDVQSFRLRHSQAPEVRARQAAEAIATRLGV
jgi:hypothetical protein